MACNFQDRLIASTIFGQLPMVAQIYGSVGGAPERAAGIGPREC